MFEDKTSQTEKKSANRQALTDKGKDINLLPEKLRSQEAKISRSAPQSDGIKYTQPAEVDSKQPSSGGIWSWFKNFSGRLRGQALRPLNRGKAADKAEVISPATPLQKLYAKEARSAVPIQPDNKSGDLDLSSQSTPVQLTPESTPMTKSAAPSPTLDTKVTTDRPLSMLEKIDQQLQKGIHIKSDQVKEAGQFGVNLIPEELVTEVDNKRVATVLGLTAILTILFIGLVYLVVDLIQLREIKQVKALQEKIQIAQDEFISKSEDLTALVGYQNFYDNIKSLLSTHIYWTQLLDYFESNVTAKTYFKDITADKNGTVTIDLVADNYLALAEQYLVFKNSPEVIRIEINKATLNSDDKAADDENIRSFIEEVETGSQGSATSSEAIVSARQLILEAYQQMPVGTQIKLQLDPNIFYKSSTTTAKIIK